MIGAFKFRIENFSEDGLRKGTEFTPWYSGQNKFANQAGSGGFMKVRDVIPHTKVCKFIDLFFDRSSTSLINTF